MEERSFKIIVIGAPGAGKSCLLNRYTKNEFSDGYNTTLGVQFTSKVVKIDNENQVKLQIWDTAGQESFKSIIQTFYRNVSAVFLVYNIASLSSFKQLEFWFSQAVENCSTDVAFILLGAQKDREDERQVTSEMAAQFMNRKKISFMFETSAKNNENVDVAFREAAKQIFLKRIGSQMAQNKKDSGKKLGKNQDSKKKKSCCSSSG